MPDNEPTPAASPLPAPTLVQTPPPPGAVRAALVPRTTAASLIVHLAMGLRCSGNYPHCRPTVCARTGSSVELWTRLFWVRLSSFKFPMQHITLGLVSLPPCTEPLRLLYMQLVDVCLHIAATA